MSQKFLRDDTPALGVVFDLVVWYGNLIHGLHLSLLFLFGLAFLLILEVYRLII